MEKYDWELELEWDYPTRHRLAQFDLDLGSELCACGVCNCCGMTSPIKNAAAELSKKMGKIPVHMFGHNTPDEEK